MERFGSELIFISTISGDGKSLQLCDEKEEGEERKEWRNKEVFKLNSLSMSNRTFIASGMTSYVVKLKNDPKIRF